MDVLQNKQDVSADSILGQGLLKLQDVDISCIQVYSNNKCRKRKIPEHLAQMLEKILRDGQCSQEILLLTCYREETIHLYGRTNILDAGISHHPSSGF